MTAVVGRRPSCATRADRHQEPFGEREIGELELEPESTPAAT
jgi:hypothetical protein